MLWPLALVLFGLVILGLTRLRVRPFAVFVLLIGIANTAIADPRVLDFTNSNRNEQGYLVVIKTLPIIQDYNHDGNLRF